MTPETQIRTLQAELATANETIRQLRDLLRPNPVTSRPAIPMAPQEDALLMLCYQRDYVRFEQAILAVSPPGRQEEYTGGHNLVKVLMCRVRKKLKPHDIHIDTIWGVGWKMTPENKAKLKALFSSAGVVAN